jgi:hypothetical protein
MIGFSYLKIKQVVVDQNNNNIPENVRKEQSKHNNIPQLLSSSRQTPNVTIQKNPF